MGIDITMVVRVPRAIDAAEVKRVAVQMQIAFGRASGSGVLWVDRQRKQHSLEIIEPTNYALEDAGIPFDGTHIRLNSYSRYYGQGYERGDLVGILAVARYLREAFAPCEVYYGGDCGGHLRLLDESYESELWKHFTGPGSRSYFTYGMRSEGTVVCDFCDVRTNAHTFSGADITSSCPSCGQSWQVNTRTGETEQLQSPR